MDKNETSILILDSGNHVDSSWVANIYTQIGFTPSISISEINTTLNTSNFDVVFIVENYSYVESTIDYVSDFLTENERQIVQNFVEQGGHVVWITENWDPLPVSFASYQTINNIYETDIFMGPFYNGSVGSENIFRVHPGMGPAGLSPTQTARSSGSYNTILNVPNCNKLYAPDVSDVNGGITFNECTNTILAIFPARPNFEVDIRYNTDYINTYNFQNSSSGGNNNDYLWDFGDSTQSEEFSPIHNYDSRQNKFVYVTLYTYDENGCMDSIKKTFRINENIKDKQYLFRQHLLQMVT